MATIIYYALLLKEYHQNEDTKVLLEQLETKRD